MKTARAMTIAGSDCSGGAGIQADLKTFQAFGVYGSSVITSVLAENTVKFSNLQAVSTQLVSEQIECCLDDIGADAVKTGMLYSAEIVRAVAEKLREHKVKHLVVDPVLSATVGGSLLDRDGLDVMRKELLPLAEIVTPNMEEAGKLAGLTIRTDIDLREAGETIGKMGPGLVVITGGDDSNSSSDLCIDWAWDGKSWEIFDSPRVAGPSPHGTGCTFSAAITALLALGSKPEDAVRGAKDYLYAQIKSAPGLGKGPTPLNHSVRVDTGGDL